MSFLGSLQGILQVLDLVDILATLALTFLAFSFELLFEGVVSLAKGRLIGLALNLFLIGGGSFEITLVSVNSNELGGID